MHIQVNTDRNIVGDQALEAQVKEKLENVLARFASRITRLEVHLSDKNAGRGGSDDIACVVEARLEGRQPLAVEAREATVERAVAAAAQKMRNMLDTELGRARPY
jgi:ribosome-associated translation inhibitor RaiA